MQEIGFSTILNLIAKNIRAKFSIQSSNKQNNSFYDYFRKLNLKMSNSNSAADLAIILTQDGKEVQIPERYIMHFPSIDTYLVCNKDDEKGTGKKFFKIPNNAPILNKFHLDLIFGCLKTNEQYNIRIASPIAKQVLLMNALMLDTKPSFEEQLNTAFKEFFAKYSSEQLIETVNVASFLGVTPVVNAIIEYFASEFLKMDVKEINGFFGEDFDEATRDRLIKWEKAVKLAKTEKQIKLGEEKQAKLDAEAKARKEKEVRERELEEAKLHDMKMKANGEYRIWEDY